MFFYWILPKVFDLGNSMRQAILFDRHAAWLMPIATSAAFGIVVLAGALRIFQKRDF
jgi:hypothetical protein